jgi:hypothetical protein
VKALVRGLVPARPLFIPIVFSLAAKLEGLEPRAFLTNPTKLTNGLSALHRRHRTDGVTAYFDPLLLAEACGCSIDWSAGMPRIAGRPTVTADVSDITGAGRVPIALEVVRRLRASLRDEPALLAGIAGPVLTGRQLKGEDFTGALEDQAAGALSSLQQLAQVSVQLAQAFCQAGADIVLVVEPSIPAPALEAWAAALSPLWNVVRFHGALPVIYSDAARVVLHALTALPCLPPDALAKTTGLQLFAVALSEGEGQRGLPEGRHGRCVMVTTKAEIPYSQDIRNLERLISELRSFARGGRHSWA